MKITIARQCASGGHQAAELLSEQLGLEIFDKKRFVEEAKKRNVYDENANFLNEKPIDSFLYSIAMSYGTRNPRDRYINFVREVTEQENCIIIGRCANHIYKDEKDCISVFLHVDKKWMENVPLFRSSALLPSGVTERNMTSALTLVKSELRRLWNLFCNTSKALTNFS